jgi:ATP/maltotriose-dependent transcriptional regulator MalT
MKSARKLIQERNHDHETASQRAAAWNTFGMIELALGHYTDARSCFEMANQAAEIYGQIVSLSMIDDNVALLHACTGDFAAAQEILARLADGSHDIGPTVVCSVQMHTGTVLRRSGAIRDSLEPSAIAAHSIPEDRDPYLYLNAKANLAFAEGLAGRNQEDSLHSISSRARAAGVPFVELKATLFAAILLALTDHHREATTMLRHCVPQQLELGHVNLLAQELGPRPQVTALILRDSSRHLIGAELLDAVSRHWDFAKSARELRERTPREVARLVTRTLEKKMGGAPCPSTSRAASCSPSDSARLSILDDLTPKELAVLRLMAASRSNTEIAEELVVAVSTVKTHVNHILRKLNQSTRIGAVLEYQRLMRLSNESSQKEAAPLHLHPRR